MPRLHSRWARRVGMGVVCALVATIVIVAVSVAQATRVAEWGSQGEGNGQFNIPQDIAVDGAGNVYVVESQNNRVQKFAGDGTFITTWGTRGTGDGQFVFPEGIAVDPAGNVYVADTSNHRIQKFDANGTYITQWGTQGTGPGQFSNPTSIDVDSAGNVYVGEFFGGQRIQKFNSDGTQLLAQWGSPGAGDGQFARPVGIVTDSAGNVYVVERDNQRIQKFTSDGVFITKWGTPGEGDGQFTSPLDVAIDPAGNVLVADRGNFRIQRFSPDGAFLSKFDRLVGSPTESFAPIAVDTDSAGDTYILDESPRMVRVREGQAPPPGPPPPEVGRTVNVEVVRGTVLVQLPRGAAAAGLAHAAQNGFRPLTGAESIPVGSVLDTKRGTVGLTSAANARGATQRANFFSGVFQVRQRRAARPITELVLKGSFRRCRRAGASQRRRGRSVRRLWGDGRGRFRTRGRYSSSAVRGTKWLVDDRCDGTLTRVREGSVLVRDFVRRRSVRLRAGQSYLARARR